MTTLPPSPNSYTFSPSHTWTHPPSPTHPHTPTLPHNYTSSLSHKHIEPLRHWHERSTIFPKIPIPATPSCLTMSIWPSASWCLGASVEVSQTGGDARCFLSSTSRIHSWLGDNSATGLCSSAWRLSHTASCMVSPSHCSRRWKGG